MKYTEMSRDEIFAIVKRGGDKLVKLDRMVLDHLHGLNLSERAEDIIATTDCPAKAFGGLFTAEEVEEYIKEYYEE